MYVSIEEANGYTTIFDVWTDYNSYVKIKLKRNPQTRNQRVVFEVEASKIKKRKKKITIKNLVLVFSASSPNYPLHLLDKSV